MKKKILFGLLCVLTLFLVTGCDTSKKAVYAEEFETIAVEQGLTVVDVKDQFAEFDFITRATVAANTTDGWQVEHYVLSDSDQAKKMFNKNKTEFEEFSTSGLKTTSIEIGNYTKYTLETDANFMLLTRVDDTLLYVKVEKAYKDDALKLVEALGY